MKPVRFIHISDSHFGEDENYLHQGVNTHRAFSCFLDMLEKLPFCPDFIIHTGDVTSDCYDKGYQMMAEMVKRSGVPWHFVTGNHDTSKQIRSFLQSPQAEYLSPLLNTYRFSQGKTDFFVIDARGPDDIDPHGRVSKEQIDLVKRQLERGVQTIFFIHYPLLPIDSTWFDENMQVVNGMTLHQLFAAHRESVRAVMFGHIHRSVTTVRDGITYSSVGSTGLQFLSYPPATRPVFESMGRGFFKIISQNEQGIIIKEMSFANDSPDFVREKKKG